MKDAAFHFLDDFLTDGRRLAITDDLVNVVKESTEEDKRFDLVVR